MTKTKEVRITIDEIRHVNWNCAGCGTEHGLDLNSKKQMGCLEHVPSTASRPEFQCAICGAGHDADLMTALRWLRDTHGMLMVLLKKNRPVYFRIDESDAPKREPSEP